MNSTPTSEPVDWKFVRELEDGATKSPLPVQTGVPVWSSKILSAEEADDIFFEVIKNYSKKHLTTVYNPKGDTVNRVDLNSRHVHWYDPAWIPSLQPILQKFDAAIVQGIKANWGLDVVSLNLPQVLGYEERCVFVNHCDNSILVDGKWVHNDPDREFTGLLYISGYSDTATFPNTFCGGVLQFQNLEVNGSLLKVHPEKGEVLTFPSGPYFMHQVTPITRGYRIAIVNWWKTR